MVISLTLVNGSHHWPTIKSFIPCSTSDHCNHMDRIVLCGIWDEDPGHLFKSAHCFFPRLRWSFVYLAWIHICMVMAMLKFASVWHRSTLYVWYLCPSLSPLSHGSMLYSSSHACLFNSWIFLVSIYSYEFGYLCLWVIILMYYRCLLDCILWSSRHFHLLVTTCSQSSRLLYHSKTHALGGILLYQNLVTIMW